MSVILSRRELINRKNAYRKNTRMGHARKGLLLGLILYISTPSLVRTQGAQALVDSLSQPAKNVPVHHAGDTVGG